MSVRFIALLVFAVGVARHRCRRGEVASVNTLKGTAVAF